MQLVAYIVLCFFVSTMHFASSSDPMKPDGINFYKDYLRGKNDEIPVISDDPSNKVLYFYRTPAQLYPGHPGFALEDILEQEFGKRTPNRFKNHMLGKDSASRVPVEKRVTDSVLSWLLANEYNLLKNGENLGGAVTAEAQ